MSARHRAVCSECVRCAGRHSRKDCNRLRQAHIIHLFCDTPLTHLVNRSIHSRSDFCRATSRRSLFISCGNKFQRKSSSITKCVLCGRFVLCRLLPRLPGLRDRAETVLSRILDRCQSYRIQHIIVKSWPRRRLSGLKIKKGMLCQCSYVPPFSDESSLSAGIQNHRASSNLCQALLALSISCLELQLMLDSHGDRQLVKSTLQQFARSLLDHFDEEREIQAREARLQAYSDLAVLSYLLRLWSVGTDENDKRVEQYLSEERSKVCYLTSFHDPSMITEADCFLFDCYRCLSWVTQKNRFLLIPQPQNSLSGRRYSFLRYFLPSYLHRENYQMERWTSLSIYSASGCHLWNNSLKQLWTLPSHLHGLDCCLLAAHLFGSDTYAVCLVVLSYVTIIDAWI